MVFHRFQATISGDRHLQIRGRGVKKGKEEREKKDAMCVYLVSLDEGEGAGGNGPHVVAVFDDQCPLGGGGGGGVVEEGQRPHSRAHQTLLLLFLLRRRPARTTIVIRWTLHRRRVLQIISSHYCIPSNLTVNRT